MRQSLVKALRKEARTLFTEQPYVAYTTTPRGNTVLTDFCIKKVVKDTKRNVNYAARSGLYNV